ncbi:unnamed protein product [marine sediment metagenome]|uniref:Uncharacterized protein n=1 Tax=marine sediment metagenome TaxID=412755 RepID=X1SMN0_9ZZZZ
MAVQEAEPPYQGRLAGLEVADVQPVTQTEEQRRDQTMDQNQAGEAVHQGSLRKLKPGGGQEAALRAGNSPRYRVAWV